MVIESIGSFAMGVGAHLAGEGPIVHSEKEFDRFMRCYEFAIENQKLKRDDIRDLTELVVQRMDMYHLIGALLLELCMSFYGDFKLLEQDSNFAEPRVIMELFLLSNIAAIGFLLFAIWLSLHASVAAHAIGVKIRLDHSRLTIPTPDNLNQMRQASSLYRMFYRAFRRNTSSSSNEDGQVSSGTLGVGSNQRPLSYDALEVGPTTVQSGDGYSMFPPTLDNALHKVEHREKFAEHLREWLRFDAYSRVTMALGINQMLQSLCYFVVGPISVQRPSSALITVIGIQSMAMYLLKLDLRRTDARKKALEEREEIENNYDVSRATWTELSQVLWFFFFPPILLVFVLWLTHFEGIVPGVVMRNIARLLITPAFFLHAAWLASVKRKIAPRFGDMLPVKLRAVGYLDIFTRDSKADHEVSPDEILPNGIQLPSKMAWCSCVEDLEAVVESNLDIEDMSTPRNRKQQKEPLVKNATEDVEGKRRRPTMSRTSDVWMGNKGADHVAWLVVGRFTKTMIWLWFIGGVVHIINCIPDELGWRKDIDGDLPQKVTYEIANKQRRLGAEWPSPARLFEIRSLQCNGSHFIISSPFSTFQAGRLSTGSGGAGEHVGSLAKLGDSSIGAVLCTTSGDCHALSHHTHDFTWQLASLNARKRSLEKLPNTVQMPQDWRMVAASWAPCSYPCEKAVLAGWDGRRVVIADLTRNAKSGEWELQPHFALHEGLGTCSSDGAASSSAEDGKYRHVRAMHLHVEHGCRTLTVLRVSEKQRPTIDSWDLISGKLLGCLQLDKLEYSAMCHDSNDIFVARQGAEGPVLESMALPQAHAHCKAEEKSDRT